jgi:hypothetical protein
MLEASPVPSGFDADPIRDLAAALAARLVRLQCYEGLSAHHALYEWDYACVVDDDHSLIRLPEFRGPLVHEVRLATLGLASARTLHTT